jgi:replication initiation protein RepC
MSKWDALRLVRSLRRELGLSRAACEVLERLADSTPSADWTDPRRMPVNFRRQIELAQEVGITTRQFRKIEHLLEQRGLIERRVAINGYRGRTAAASGATGVAGISLVPLIWRMPELVGRAEQAKADREACAALRIDIRVAWRALTHLLRHTAAAALREARLETTPPTRDALLKLGIDELRHHLHAIQEAADKVQMSIERVTKSSGAPEQKDRSHTENTTGTELKSCNATAHGRTASKLADADSVAGPAGPEDCLEDEAPAGKALDNPDRALALTPQALRDLATEELRIYIDGGQEDGRPRTMSDVERAVAMRLRELGINPSAYEETQDAIGWFDAMLAVIVIDRNRSHPATPIRNPGGTLRAFVRRARAGELNLAASVFGIWARESA